MKRWKRGRVPFWGKLCAAVICAAVVLTSAGDSAAMIKASATDTDAEIAALEQKIKNLNQQNEQNKNKINGLTGDISENKAAMQTVSDLIVGIRDEIDACGELIEVKSADISAKSAEIDAKSAEIDAVTLSIADKEREIEDRLLEIAELRAQNRENLAKFAKLARAMYMNDSSGTLPILSGSDDWYDFFVYSDVVKNISGQNVMFMERLQNSIKQQETLIEELDRTIESLGEDKQKLEEDKQKLEEQKKVFEAQKADFESQMYNLTVNAETQQNYIDDLASQNQQLQNQISSLQSQINKNNNLAEEYNAAIAEIIRKAQEENVGQVVYDENYLWPVGSAYRKITTNFGYSSYHGGQHNGIDITGSSPGIIGGTNIYAAQSGTVIIASATCPDNYGKNYSCGHGWGYGNYVVIDHGNGVSTLYGHQASINVTKGQHVNKGDVIGKVGSTGWSTGYHLHFELRKNDRAINPLSYNYQYIG